MTKKQKKVIKNRTTKDYSRTFQLFNRVLLALIIFSGVSFIISINDLSIKGFMLEELKNEVSKLNIDNENIELQVAALESYENIEKRAGVLKMVKVDKIEYISIDDEVVAKK